MINFISKNNVLLNVIDVKKNDNSCNSCNSMKKIIEFSGLPELKLATGEF